MVKLKFLQIPKENFQPAFSLTSGSILNWHRGLHLLHHWKSGSRAYSTLLNKSGTFWLLNMIASLMSCTLKQFLKSDKVEIQWALEWDRSNAVSVTSDMNYLVSWVSTFTSVTFFFLSNIVYLVWLLSGISKILCQSWWAGYAAIIDSSTKSSLKQQSVFLSGAVVSVALIPSSYPSALYSGIKTDGASLVVTLQVAMAERKETLQDPAWASQC